MAKRRKRRTSQTRNPPSNNGNGNGNHGQGNDLYLVGRPFAITIASPPSVVATGYVCGQVDDINYLVEFNEEEILIIGIATMTTTTDPNKATWHFFEDAEARDFWVQAIPRPTPTEETQQEPPPAAA